MRRILLTVLAFSGCGTSDPGPTKLVDEGAPCGAEYPSYTPGMTVKAGPLTAKLVSASPSPPRQKVPNHWSIELTDEQGKPLTDFTLGNPDSFMPVHNHHGRTPPTIKAAQIADIDFNMRGPWQVLFDVQRPGLPAATATFQVCVR